MLTFDCYVHSLSPSCTHTCTAQKKSIQTPGGSLITLVFPLNIPLPFILTGTDLCFKFDFYFWFLALGSTGTVICLLQHYFWPKDAFPRQTKKVISQCPCGPLLLQLSPSTSIWLHRLVDQSFDGSITVPGGRQTVRCGAAHQEVVSQHPRLVCVPTAGAHGSSTKDAITGKGICPVPSLLPPRFWCFWLKGKWDILLFISLGQEGEGSWDGYAQNTLPYLYQNVVRKLIILHST